MDLFLTSSAADVAHDIPNHTDLSKGNKLVFIDTAAEPEKDGDISWLINDRKALVNAGFDVTDYTITDKNLSALKDYLPQFDYIYLSGGNTAHLLTESYKSGFVDYIKKLVNSGKVYIGTSAGSIIAGPNIPKYLIDKNAYAGVAQKPAYDFVNFTVVPHWGSEDFKKQYLEERLKTMYKDSSVPFILLTNKQYLHIKDEYIKIINLNS